MEWPYLRLAEVYLIYAEACLQAKGDFSGAIANVNKVRARVGLGDLNTCNPDKNLMTNKEALLEEILRERACELGLEDVRFFDMIRYKRDDLFKKTLHGLRIYRNDGGGDKPRVERMEMPANSLINRQISDMKFLLWEISHVLGGVILVRNGIWLLSHHRK